MLKRRESSSLLAQWQRRAWSVWRLGERLDETKAARGPTVCRYLGMSALSLSAGSRRFSELWKEMAGLSNGRRRWCRVLTWLSRLALGHGKNSGADLAPRGEFVQTWLWIGDAKTSWKCNPG